MESNREVFLRMSEEEYLLIPHEVRQSHLGSKRIDSESSDWIENMKDDLFAELYKQKKAKDKELKERQYQLREARRNGK